MKKIAAIFIGFAISPLLSAQTQPGNSVTAKEAIPQFEVERKKAVGEKFEEFKTTAGKIYKSVTIRGVDDKGMKIIHSAGSMRIPLADLSKELQTRFGYDPQRTADAIAQESKVRRERSARNAKLTTKKRKIQKEKAQEHAEKEIAGEKNTKITALEKRIATMRKGIAKAEVEIKELGEKVEYYEKRGRKHFTVKDENGRDVQMTRTSQTHLNRAKSLRKRSLERTMQVLKAKNLIGKLEKQIGEINAVEAEK